MSVIMRLWNVAIPLSWDVILNERAVSLGSHQGFLSTNHGSKKSDIITSRNVSGFQIGIDNPAQQ